jgi:K+-sensing histidine kinase KdpD
MHKSVIALWASKAALAMLILSLLPSPCLRANNLSTSDSLSELLNIELKRSRIDSQKVFWLQIKLMTEYQDQGLEDSASLAFTNSKKLAFLDTFLYVTYSERIHHFIRAHNPKKVIELSEALITTLPNFPYATSFAYQGMGMASAYLGDNQNSKKYYENALHEGKKTNNQVWISNIKMDLAATLFNTLDIDSIFKIYTEAIKNLENSKDSLSEATVGAYSNLGTIYFSVDVDSAIKYLIKSKDMAITLGFKRNAAIVSSNLGVIYLKTKHLNKAEQEIRTALELFEEQDNYSLHGKLYQNLSLINSNNNKWARSMAYLDSSKKYNQLNSNQERTKAIAEARTKFDLAEEELKNKLLEQEKAQAENLISFQRTLVIVVLVFLVLALFFILTLIRNRKTIKNLNLNLNKKNALQKELLVEKDHLMGVLIHDVRSPMASVYSATDIIHSNYEDFDAHTTKEILKEMNLTSEKGLEMVNSIWDIYNVENNTAKLETQSIYLDRLIEEIQSEFAPTSQKRKIAIETELDQIQIKSHHDYLTVVLRNLLSNALKFSESNTTISLIAKHQKGMAELRIRDQGPRFKPEDHEHLFKKFQKLSAQPLHGERSSGLGLYLIHLICQKLDIAIELNQSYETGAEFILRIPA